LGEDILADIRHKEGHAHPIRRSGERKEEVKEKPKIITVME